MHVARHHATLEERLDYLEKVEWATVLLFTLFSTFPEIGSEGTHSYTDFVESIR